MSRLSYLALLTALAVVVPTALHAANEQAPAPQAAERPLQYDTIRLRAGAVLAGSVIGYSTDSILMKVFGVERAYKIADIEDLRTANSDPDFLWTVLGAALKSGNVSLTVGIARRDKDLGKMVLGYPQFQETLNAYRSAGDSLDALLPAQAQTARRREQAFEKMSDLEANIVESQKIIANPFYYETATVTRSATCPTCGGVGVVRWVTMSDRDRADEGHSRIEARRCPNCLGLGEVTVSSVEEVQRRRDTNAEAANIVGWRAEWEKWSQALAGYEKQWAKSEKEIASSRAALAAGETRLGDLCREMAQRYFP